MRILFNTANRANLVTIRKYHWLEQEVAKHANCKFWGPNRQGYRDIPLDQVIEQLYGDDSPDWVIATPYMHSEHRRWIGYKCPPPTKRSWKIAVFTDDLHSNSMLGVSSEGYCEALNQAGFDVVLMWYTKLGYAKRPYHQIDPDYFPKHLKAKVIHFPKFVNENVLHPIPASKLYDAVCLGAVQARQYPLRHAVWNELPQLASRYGWKILLRGKPPGSSDTRDITRLAAEGHIVGDKYTEAVARSKVHIFGNSIYKYGLLRIFEAWACGTLLMCDRPYGWRRLCMEDGENYVRVDMDNWIQKLKYYLDHDTERERIARNGYETVVMNHTVGIRVKEFLKTLEDNR